MSVKHGRASTAVTPSFERLIERVVSRSPWQGKDRSELTLEMSTIDGGELAGRLHLVVRGPVAGKQWMGEYYMCRAGRVREIRLREMRRTIEVEERVPDPRPALEQLDADLGARADALRKISQSVAYLTLARAGALERLDAEIDALTPGDRALIAPLVPELRAAVIDALELADRCDAVQRRLRDLETLVRERGLVTVAARGAA